MKDSEATPLREVHNGPIYYVDGVEDLAPGDLVTVGTRIWSCPEPSCTSTEELHKTQASIKRVMHDHA